MPIPFSVPAHVRHDGLWETRFAAFSRHRAPTGHSNSALLKTCRVGTRPAVSRAYRRGRLSQPKTRRWRSALESAAIGPSARQPARAEWRGSAPARSSLRKPRAPRDPPGALRQGVLDGSPGRPLVGSGQSPAARANHVPRPVRTRGGWSRPETGPEFNLPAAGGRRAARGLKRGAGRPPCGGGRGSVRDGRPPAVCALHGCRWKVGTGTRLAIGRSRTTGQVSRPGDAGSPAVSWTVAEAMRLWLEGDGACRVKS
ncbi:MAG: hypothetical protein KatS3mg132_608 [Limisphaera sp.]|nr:MAG: hypothetical protein KatS3mg132_608 [Limisphaera sp.]